MQQLKKMVKKYRFVLLVLLAGVALMLLPTGTKEAALPETEQAAFSLPAVQQEMESLLGRMEGVGRVKVMLTLKSGSTLQLAADEDTDQRNDETRREKQVVKLSRGSGRQEVVVTEEIYPTYLGAVVVCEGADNSAVRLHVVEAVAVLTSLPSDRITVVKWEEDT